MSSRAAVREQARASARAASAVSRSSAAVLAVLFAAGCPSFHRGPMPGEPGSDTYETVDDVRVRYLDVGDESAPALVLLHGFASSIEAWSAMTPQLAERHRVLALDLKGFGWTDRPEGDYSPDAQAQLVLALMDARGIERAAVVGHSWGASVALAVARRAPERVSRLALFDAWVYEAQLPELFVWARARGLGEMLFSMFYKERPEDRLLLAYHDPAHVTQELVDAVHVALDRPGTTAAALAAVRGQRFAAIEDGYRTVTQPTLLIWGREDAVTPLRYADRLLGELPDARLVVLPDCGHLPMVESPSASTRALLTFLDEERP